MSVNSRAKPSVEPGGSNSASGTRKQLPALTGLRIVAATMIVLFHSADTFSIDHSHFIASFSLIQGVSLFFVLSGFILTYTYANLASPRESIKFILLRLARIWPVHAVTAVFAIFFLSHKWAGHAYVLAPNLLLLQDWLPIQDFFFSLNAVSWSVSAELFFYCCFPFLSLGFKRRPVLTLLGSFLVAATFLYISRYFPLPANHAAQVTSFGLVYVNPLVRLFEFAIGIATARLYFRYQSRLSQITARTAFALEALIISLVFFAVCGIRHVFTAPALDAVAPNLSMWVDTSGGFLAYAALIFLLAIEKGSLYKVLSKSWMVWLGEISYSVYLVHWLWIKVFVNLQFGQLHLPRYAAFGIYCFAVFASAALLYTFVEKPARSFLGRKIHAWR